MHGLAAPVRMLATMAINIAAAKMVANSVFFAVFRHSGAHSHRAVADAAAGATHRWVEVMEGPTGASLAVRR